MSNDCIQVQSLLSEYIDGVLPAGSAWRVQMHLAVCTACADMARSMRKTVDLLQGMSRVSVSDRFDAGLAAKMTGLLPADPARSNVFDRIMRSLRMASVRWQDRSHLALATAVAVMLACVLLTPSVVSMHGKDVIRTAPPIASIGAVPAGDLEFVAACSNEHAQYQSTQAIADPTAEIVAAREDEAGAPINIVGQPSSDGFDSSDDTE